MVVTGNKKDGTLDRFRHPGLPRRARKDHYTFWMAAGSGYATGASPTLRRVRGLNLPPEILKKIYETNIDKALARFRQLIFRPGRTRVASNHRFDSSPRFRPEYTRLPVGCQGIKLHSVGGEERHR